MWRLWHEAPAGERPARQTRASRGGASGRRRRPGPAPAPMLAQAVADRLARRSRAPPRAASSGLQPSARCAASADECVQPEPCAAPSGCRSPGIACELVAVEEDVGRLLAVAAGDDDRAPGRARAAPARAPRASPASAARPRQHARLRQVRGDHGGPRQQLARRAPRGRRRRAARRRTRRPSPGRSRSACRAPAARAPRATAQTVAGRAEHPDLDRVDADVVGHGADLRDDELRRDRVDRRRRRRCSARSAP